MRRTATRLAVEARSGGRSSAPSPLTPQGLALLPPIPLYRRLLRAHRRHLGTEERLLGDQYIKAEFRAHRAVDNPMHIIGFLTEWQLYCQKLEGNKWMGERMDAGKIDKMSEEQINQMYELMMAIRRTQLDDGDEDGGELDGDGERRDGKT